MEKYTEELIEEEMKGIHEVDLQNRLRKMYEEKKKIDSAIFDNQEDKDFLEKIKILRENIDLSIKVYEKNLPINIIERAKRSAGMYETEKEFSDSVKRGEEIEK